MWLAIVITLVVAASIALPLLRLLNNPAAKLAKTGEVAMADLLAIAQTGLTVNGLPEMRLTVRVERAGEASAPITFKQLIGLGNMPRVGERVYVMVDRKDPSKVAYAGPLSMAAVSGQSPAEIQQSQDTLAIAPSLREAPVLGVGVITSIAAGASGAMRVGLNIDSVTEPPRPVTVEQVMSGFTYQVGDRAYVFVDKADPDKVALVPLSYTGGQKLSKEANRLDALVLGPQLLTAGKKAQGEVTSAEQVPLSNPMLAAGGASRWKLGVRITPQDGRAPYDGVQTIAFTSPDKVERMARVGARVPIRYDANDPQSFVIDSIAMGYPDPYAAARKMVEEAQSRGADLLPSTAAPAP